MKIFILNFISLILLSGLTAAPKWDALDQKNLIWMCPDTRNAKMIYYMPAYLKVTSEFHEVSQENEISVYKFKIENWVQDRDLQALFQDDVKRKFIPFPVYALEVGLFKKLGGKKIDYTIPLEKDYFQGSLTHWALPSHIILTVPASLEPSFQRLISFQRVLPYQYLIKVGEKVEDHVFKPILIPLYIQKEEKDNEDV
ncbi:MAG: hypothetical protein A3B70_01775 [Deltaproteobacteria bacterium RIFCSPHIGHO2_02_FULL_40_11]|nr:MAG: hypothetical protein A3B70_01775 [Deltaproteobacteria bacterium RIFCSPHIGHO2_02_FULL_40_11]